MMAEERERQSCCKSRPTGHYTGIDLLLFCIIYNDTYNDTNDTHIGSSTRWPYTKPAMS